MTPLTAALAYGVLVAVGVLAVRAYLRFRRMELSIPGPASLPVLGNLMDLAGLPETERLNGLLRMWGGRRNLSRFSILGKLIVFVTEPADIEAVTRRKDLEDKSDFFYGIGAKYVGHTGLITATGETARRHRRALQPAYKQENLNRFVQVFAEESQGFVQRVRPGEEVDVHDNLTRTLSRSILRSSITKNVADFDDFVVHCIGIVERFIKATFERAFNPLLGPDFVYLRLARGQRLAADTADIEQKFASEIRKLRAELDGVHDSEKRCRTLAEILLQKGEGEGAGMTDQEVIDEIKTNIFAAVETQAGALAFALKVLSMRQDLQDRVYRELVEVFDGTKRPVQADDLSRLEYTERFIKESMRLFPPVPFTARQVHRDTELSSHKLPAGTTLLLNIYGAHRNPDQWPEPLVFDPDRFLPERSRGRHPHAFMAFSSGPRSCIGSKYAMMSMKTALATVLREFRVARADDPYTDIHQLPLTTDLALRVIGGVRVVFATRPSPAPAPSG